jgi:imidazolonepropionase
MNLLIRNIKQLVTVNANGRPFKSGKEMLDLAVIENATVLIRDGIFVWIGRDAEYKHPVDNDLDTIDGSELTALPGFVDPSTHLLFAGNPMEYCTGETDTGLLAVVQATRASAKRELKKYTRRHLDAMLSQGTTTVEIKSGYGLKENTEIKILESINELSEESLADIVSTFFIGAVIPPKLDENPEEYLEAVCVRIIPYIARRKMTGFCELCCDEEYFSEDRYRRIVKTAGSSGLKIRLRADRSLQRAEGTGALLATGLSGAGEADIEKMERNGMIAVVLPGESFFLNGRYAPARRIIDAGVPLAIATDFNPVSCMSYSMPLMMTISCAQMSLKPEEAITAATLNSAAAIGVSDKVGSIETGKQADIVLYNVPDYRYLIHHFGMNHAVKVIKRGTYLDF